MSIEKYNKNYSKEILVKQTRRPPVSQNCLNIRVSQTIIYKYPSIVSKKKILFVILQL